MRLTLQAIALSVCVTPFGLAAVPATAVLASTAAPDAAASDAAARHAKRTACLKQAKAKKLAGAEKNSFIKDCIAAR